MINYEIVQGPHHNGFDIVHLLDAPYEGVEFHFGAVSVEERDGTARLKFDYVVLAQENKIKDRNAFGEIIGEVLSDVIDKQLVTGDVVYAGGV